MKTLSQKLRRTKVIIPTVITKILAPAIISTGIIYALETINFPKIEDPARKTVKIGKSFWYEEENKLFSTQKTYNSVEKCGGIVRECVDENCDGRTDYIQINGRFGLTGPSYQILVPYKEKIYP